MTRVLIDLYPGTHAIEDVPAEFTIEDVPADPSVGESGGKWATLESVQIGGLTLLRSEIQVMIGARSLCAIEGDVSERLSMDAAEPLLRYA